MDKKQKVWIRGCEGKGADVIQKLVALGGKDLSVALTYLALNPSFIFFITNFEEIAYTDDNTELAKIIMEEYTEIKLKEKVKDESVNKTKDQPEFKVDDMVLIRDSHDDKWQIFQYWYLLSRMVLSSFAEIIPYNEETKHLLNTTDKYVP